MNTEREATLLFLNSHMWVKSTASEKCAASTHLPRVGSYSPINLLVMKRTASAGRKHAHQLDIIQTTAGFNLLNTAVRTFRMIRYRVEDPKPLPVFPTAPCPRITIRTVLAEGKLPVLRKVRDKAKLEDMTVY